MNDTTIQTAQGSGGVTIPGGVQKTCRCGTSGHGLAGVVVIGWQLDLMILEVFSNLNDSMILFYDSVQSLILYVNKVLSFPVWPLREK